MAKTRKKIEKARMRGGAGRSKGLQGCLGRGGPGEGQRFWAEKPPPFQPFKRGKGEVKAPKCPTRHPKIGGLLIN